MPLARSLARRYHRGEEPLEDLEQVAALGLLKAIKGFDPDRGSAFASFAVPTIVGELRRHFRDKGWGVRVPRDLQELALAVQRKADVMTTEIGRPPTAEELAEKLGRDVEDVLEAREALRAMRPASLDRPSAAGEDEDDIPLARIGGSTPATSAPRRPSRSAASSATCPSASAGSSRCASPATSPSPRSASSSASRRCTSRACCAARSRSCTTRPRSRPPRPGRRARPRGVSASASISSVPVSSSSRRTGGCGPATTSVAPASSSDVCARSSSRSIVESMNSDPARSATTSRGRLGHDLVDERREAGVHGEVELARELEHDDALRRGPG